MRALDDMDYQALRDYARDLLHQRGVAAGDIDRRRQELPYHPLLAQYEEGSEALRERLSRAMLALLKESAHGPWAIDVLHYLLVVVEETGSRAAIETLKSLVSSRAWMQQPDGKKRQMLALRTLLGLGWFGAPNFWLAQHRRLESSYPQLIFRALAEADLELAFDYFGALVLDAEQARDVLRLFPSLIERHSLEVVRELTQQAARDLDPVVVNELSPWFAKRGYGSISSKETSRRHSATRPTESSPGLQEISVPAGVKVHLEDNLLVAEGPKGRVAQPMFPECQVTIDGGTIKVSRSTDSGVVRAKHGLARALLANAVRGVAEGFKKELEVVGVGYRGDVKGKEVHFALGYSHPVIYRIPEGIEIEIDQSNKITIQGTDRQKVGIVAAEIRRLRPSVSYRAKGIRYVGEIGRRKADKSGGSRSAG